MNHRSILRLFNVTHLCILACLTCLTLFTNAAPLRAQSSTAAPLNLGTVIQNTNQSAAPAPSYLKLPETIQLPKDKPASMGNASAETDLDQGSPSAVPLEGETDLDPSIDPAVMTPPAQAPQIASPSPMAQPAEPKIQPGGIARLDLKALLSDDGQILQRGVNWRVYGTSKDETDRLPLLHNIDGGSVEIELEPGSYVVYAGYGYANLTKRVVLAKAGNYSESFNLRAGAIRLKAVAAGDIALDDNILSFDVYTNEDAETGAHSLLARNIKPEHVIKLTEGTYHIVSNYGDANAIVRGDVEVTAGKLVNVTMFHNAAKITLRLVSEPGGEALANTVWTVFTPGGDVVKRAIGAFPTLALAAGDYTAIAKQNEEVYNREFTVTTGLDRDIEVLATIQ